MKKLLCIVAAVLLILSGCRVGPKEPGDTLDSSDISSVADMPQNDSGSSESQTPEPAAEPSEPYAPEKPVEPEEPVEPQDTAPAEDHEIPDLSDEDYDADVYDHTLTLYATGSVRVRSGPSTDYESIGYISEGDEVIAFGESGSWYAIFFEDGYGFVSGGYMSETPVG